MSDLKLNPEENLACVMAYVQAGKGGLSLEGSLAAAVEAVIALRRTQPEATAPAPEQRIADALAELASTQKPLDSDMSKIIFDNMWALYGDDFGAKGAPAQDLSAAILARQIIQDTNDTLREQSEGLKQLKAENDQLRAALASSANALSAGDSEKAMQFLLDNEVDTIYLDDGRIIDVGGKHQGRLIEAILQSQKDGHDKS